jgi:hypothetical protein
MAANTGQVFVYNSATDTGYLLLDLDNDASNKFESGAMRGRGSQRRSAPRASHEILNGKAGNLSRCWRLKGGKSNFEASARPRRGFFLCIASLGPYPDSQQVCS